MVEITEKIPSPELTTILFCGYPGENHQIVRVITAIERLALKKSHLLYCPAHQAFTVGLLPESSNYGPADT